MEPLPRVFDMWKAFDLLNKMRCILRVEARFEACDDTVVAKQNRSLQPGLRCMEVRYIEVPLYNETSLQGTTFASPLALR